MEWRWCKVCRNSLSKNWCSLTVAALGMAYDLDEQRCGIVILNHPETVHEGQGVSGLNQLPDLPVGQELMGRVVDALGAIRWMRGRRFQVSTNGFRCFVKH